MFNRKSEKFKPMKIKAHIQSEGCEISDTYSIDSSENFFEVLQELHKNHGTLQMDFVDDSTLNVTNIETIQERDVDKKLDEMKDMMENYIKGQAYPMTAFAVTVDGHVKGVFTASIHASLKRKLLYQSGIEEERINIQTIDIGSMKDF